MNVSTVFGKGTCRHAQVDKELEVEPWAFLRCSSCGLAAIDWPGRMRVFACGLCGHFVRRCRRA